MPLKFQFPKDTYETELTKDKMQQKKNLNKRGTGNFTYSHNIFNALSLVINNK